MFATRFSKSINFRSLKHFPRSRDGLNSFSACSRTKNKNLKPKIAIIPTKTSSPTKYKGKVFFVAKSSGPLSGRLPLKSGYKGLQIVTGGYRGLQRVTTGYKGLQGVTEGYRGLQRVTRGYKGLQRVTRGYQELQRLEWIKKSFRGLQGVTRGYRGFQRVTGLQGVTRG